MVANDDIFGDDNSDVDAIWIRNGNHSHHLLEDNGDGDDDNDDDDGNHDD